MKKTKKAKKLSLSKETLTNLEQVAVSQVAAGASEGPLICWFSDCNPCYDMQAAN